MSLCIRILQTCTIRILQNRNVFKSQNSLIYTKEQIIQPYTMYNLYNYNSNQALGSQAKLKSLLFQEILLELSNLWKKAVLFC